MTQDDRLERLLTAWQEAAGDDVVLTGQVRSTMPGVWEASDFVAQACLRSPLLLGELAQAGDLERCYGSGEIDARLEASLRDTADEPTLAAALRLFRNREMVRIIWRDIAGWADLDETLADLSALADACVRCALEKLYGWLSESAGTPRNASGEAQGMVVVGMGKLGARELNLSSDIDLIFAFPDDGQTDGRRPLANEQFFTRLGQKLIKALNSQTAEGFVFRVDMRLRPFGEAGPLATSFGFMENYYQSQAREWERYAMVKARVIAGDREAGRALTEMLRPFVYRRYIDFGAIESLREMKRLISDSLYDRGMDANIKLGPGGIREIEFIGQAFQLIRGGRDPDLQVRPIQQVLRRLADKGLMPSADTDDLIRAYRFLRAAENRLQAWRDEQTQLLPQDPPARARLARSMGFDRWEDFSSELAVHRSRVRRHFDMLFAAREEDDGGRSALADVWRQPQGSGSKAALVGAGYPEPEAVLALLGGFGESRAARTLGDRGREQMGRLMPMVLAAAGTAEGPLEVLERVLVILEAIARRTAYLDLLVENPGVLDQLVRLTSASPWFAEQIARQPVLLDELVDPRALYAPLGREPLRRELTHLLEGAEGDLEQEMERLRQFVNMNRLRVAAADVTGVVPLMVVSDYLTDVAEITLEQALKMAWRDLTARHGEPQDIEGTDTGFAIVGYGKLGGIELGYGSDLDLVFLHGSRDVNAATNGARPLANDVFYARLGQRLVFILTTRTPAGIAYEVDMRLRPNGNAGMLVSSLAAFEAYQRDQAWTWEHQALIRARFIAGDETVAACFEAVRRSVLGRERDVGSLRIEVREMREKMRANLDKSTSEVFDLKQGRGGITDIEFMVQFCVLRWAHRYPDLLEWTDNIRLLDTLARHRLLEGRAADQLANMYRVLRAAFHRHALRDRPGLIATDELAEERRLVAEMWVEMMGERETGEGA